MPVPRSHSPLAASPRRRVPASPRRRVPASSPLLPSPLSLRSRPAFTLAEMLLAICITAAIALCIAVMIAGTADGTAGSQDGRRHLVRMQALQERLTSTLHAATSILQVGANYVIYWRNDDNADGAVELGELGMLALENNQLKQYATVWPNGWTIAQINSANTEYAATSNWYSSIQSAKGVYFLPTVLANNVTAFTVNLDNATPTQAVLVTTTVTLNDGTVTRTGTFVATLRTQTAPQ